MVALAPDFLDAVALDEARTDRAICKAKLTALRAAMLDITDEGYLWKLTLQCEAYERAIARYDEFIRGQERGAV